MKPYWWWQGASVQELTDRLNEAGPGARLEAHLGDGFSLHFRVIGAADYDRAIPRPDINDSHICPPQC